MKVNCAALLLAVVSFLGLPGWAQAPTPRSRGGLDSSVDRERVELELRIVDTSGSAVPMARVNLSSMSGARNLTAFSDSDGRALFNSIPAGNYQVNVAATGYQSYASLVNLRGGTEFVRIVVESIHGRTERTTTNEASTSLAEEMVPEKARSLFRKGKKEAERKNYEKAIQHFQASIRAYPSYAAAHAALGMAYLMLRQDKLAQEAYEKAVSLDAHLVDAQVGLAVLYNDARRFAEAEKHLLEAERLNPGDWHVDYELGRSYYGLNQFEKAEQHLRAAHVAHPGYANLHILLANVLVLRGKLSEGLGEMEEYLRLAPDSPIAPQVREKVGLLTAELNKAGPK